MQHNPEPGTGDILSVILLEQQRRQGAEETRKDDGQGNIPLPAERLAAGLQMADQGLHAYAEKEKKK